MAKLKADMTKGKILSQLIWFSLPIMATSIIQQLFNTADTIVVGRWGGDTPEASNLALSAVGACGPVNSMVITLFIGISLGAGVVVSHAVGAKQWGRIRQTVHTAVLTAAILGVLLGVLGFLCAEPLLRFFDTPEEIIPQAALYMRAYFCGLPAQLIYNYCAAMLRSAGDTTRPLIFLSVAGVVNLILNLIMVIVFKTGALGVGVATAASQWVSCIMILISMIRTDGYCHFEWKHLRLHLPTLKRMLAIGVPAGIQNSMFAIGNVIMQTAVNSLNSTVYISGNSIASNVGTYTQLIGGSIVQAEQVFVGQNAGAKNMERVRRSVCYSAILVSVVAITINSILNLVSEPILAVFAPGNPEVIAFAKSKLLISSSFYFLAHLSDLFAGTMRGMGKSTLPMFVSIFGICGVRVLWIYTVFAYFRHPLVIFAAYGVSWFVASIAQFIAYRGIRRKVEWEWKIEMKKSTDAKTVSV